MARAYYNEWDKHAAAWLRALITQGHLPAGDVDERSIADVHGSDLRGYADCHFFAGIGGWPYALAQAGFCGPVWTGSCPCQPFSAAGKRLGTADARHLWPEFHRLIAKCRPPVVFGEQVASKDGRGWLSGVRADLEALGYGVGAADLCAAGEGAPHIRQRLYWVARGRDTEDGRSPKIPQSREGWPRTKFMGDCATSIWDEYRTVLHSNGHRYRVPSVKSGIPLMVNGFPSRLAQLRGIGNAIVPQVAASFVTIYMEAVGYGPISTA